MVVKSDYQPYYSFELLDCLSLRSLCDGQRLKANGHQQATCRHKLRIPYA
jgi:hypothetical protein